MNALESEEKQCMSYWLEFHVKLTSKNYVVNLEVSRQIKTGIKMKMDKNPVLIRIYSQNKRYRSVDIKKKSPQPC